MNKICLCVLAASILLRTPPTWAESHYSIAPLIKAGDRAGNGQLKVIGFEIGTLNDRGQLVFVTENAVGGEALIQYSDGKLTPIVIAGGAAPTPSGRWPQNIYLYGRGRMNQRGNVVFTANVTEDNLDTGTFRWDYQSRQVVPVALPGTLTINEGTFQEGGLSPVINNNDEVALDGCISFPKFPDVGAGIGCGRSLLMVDRSGKPVPVALTGQALPGGSEVYLAMCPSMNDVGVVAFLAANGSGPNAYVWENGNISQVAASGASVPGAGAIGWCADAFVNNTNRNVLVVANFADSGSFGAFLFTGGKLRPVLVPGQPMPEGGSFQSLQRGTGYTIGWWVSAMSEANASGQHAFLATLTDGSTAAYLLDPDGRVSLILKTGTLTNLGRITQVGGGFIDHPDGGDMFEGGFGIGLNSKGQVVLTVRIDCGPETMVMLTPLGR